MTLWELIAAMAVLAAVSTVCFQFFHAAARQRRATQQRLIAIQEAASLMERATAIDWDKLDPESAGRLRLSPEAARWLPGGEAEIRLDDMPGTPVAKRLTVRVRWQPAGHAAQEDKPPPQSVQLAGWRYKTW
jgi:hypothetical protein